MAADGYIRVSRRGGREGESFISPEVQRKKIADWAKLNNVEIAEWWEEIDQSGARLQAAHVPAGLARCEPVRPEGSSSPDSTALPARPWTRSSRSSDFNEAGARLVSVEDNFDGSTPMGRFAIGILTLIAELELERINENWSIAVNAAVDRGVHIRPTPVGYPRRQRARLSDREPAPHVAEVFRKRALGASWVELARYLEDA